MKATEQAKKNKPKAVIYSRVSSVTDRQNYDSQTMELKEAKENEFEIIEIFEERISGRTKANTRIKFNRMLECIREHNVKNILVWEVSRLSRRMADSVNIIEDWNTQGINTFIKNHNLNTLHPDGKVNTQTMLNIHMLQAFSEFELETTRSRVIRGLKASKLKGGANGAIQPFGFKNVAKKLVVEEEEKEIVQLIYKMYLEGNGCQKIAQHLNVLEVQTRFAKTFGEKEIKTRTGRIRKGSSYNWTDNTIREIIRNPLYKGERRHKDTVIMLKDLNISPFLTVSDWNIANENMKSKANNNGETRFTNCMKGKLFCGVCGSSIFQHARKNNKDWAYKCLTKRQKYKNPKSEPCTNKGANIDKVNNTVFHLLKTLDKATILNWKTKLQKEYTHFDIESRKAHKQIENLEPEKDRLNTVFMKGRIKEQQYDKEFEALEIKEKALRDILRICAIRSTEILKAYASGVGKELNSDPSKFKEDVERWIKHIKVFTPNIDKYLHMYSNKQDFVIRLDVVLVDGSEHEIIFSSRTNKTLINGKQVEIEKVIDISPL
jgi:site-specific DNA recombinase